MRHTAMHPVLQRQLKKLGIDPESSPSQARWRDLLARVSRSYGDADQDRYTMERSLAICSREMQDLYDGLRRSSEHRLAKMVAVLEATQEVAIDGILVVDSERKTMTFNRRFAMLWRLSPEVLATGEDEKLLAAVMHLLVRPDEFRARIEYLHAHPHESSRDELELVDGRIMDRYSAPVRSSSGEPFGRVWFFRDITTERGARHKLESWAAELERRVADRTAELEKAQARLISSERLAAVGQLAAGAAHEINNPLAYVVANLDYAACELRKVVASEQAGQLRDVLAALEDAQDGADRIRHTARDLKVFSRGEKDVRSAIDVGTALESSMNMAWNEIRHRARLVRDLQPVPKVEANEGRLGQVFLNLLLNAAQAIQEGASDCNEIRVATRATASRVIVEISDTGAGIRPENMSRIFEPFFTTKPVGVGTGLGLSICHGIVKGLGGDIEVDSAVGRGTTIRILLPVALASAAADKRPPRTSHPKRRGRVLVIDDEPRILEVARRALYEHHDIVTQQDAQHALQALRGGEQFDAIVCDLMMPNLTGMDLHGALPEATAGKMVFMTGGAFTERTRSFLDRVDNPRVDKPFAVDDLLAAIDSRMT